MPKPRVIDPAFFDDLDIASLTRDERLLITGMIAKCADDYGRLRAHPKYLRKEVFGYDEDITAEDVAIMREHIIAHWKNILLYTVNGEEYFYIKNWDKFQKIRYRVPSKLPPPPSELPQKSEDDYSEPAGDSAQLSREISDNFAENSHQFSAKVTPNSPRVVLSSVEKSSRSVELNTQNDDNHNKSPPLDDITMSVSREWAKARGGLVNSLDAEMLEELEQEYGPQWVLDAIREANKSRTRGRAINLKFVESILQRWKQEGKDSQFRPAGKIKWLK